MFDFLDRLRAKSEATRMRIVILASLLITALIFFVWFGVQGVRLERTTIDTETENTSQTGRSPFAAFKEGVSEIFEEGKQQVEDFQGAFPSTEEEAEEVTEGSTDIKELQRAPQSL